MLFRSADIYRSEKLKWKLVSEHKETSLEEAVEGKVKENEIGPFYESTVKREVKIQKPSFDDMKESILSDFRLIRGIGEKTEEKLKEQERNDMRDLLEEGKYDDEVREIIEAVESRQLSPLCQRIEKWHQLSHPIWIDLLGMHDFEDILFFDIETMGLRYKPAFLIGVGRYSEPEFKVKQYLARDLKEEKAIIHQLLNELGSHDMLVSFNGRSFDLRFIRERMEMFDMEHSFDISHIDLLHVCRGRWKNDTSDHKLETLECEILGKEREEDVSSAMVPHFYKMYLEKDNPGPLIPIIEHNRDDIVSLGLLLDNLYEN